MSRRGKEMSKEEREMKADRLDCGPMFGVQSASVEHGKDSAQQERPAQ